MKEDQIELSVTIPPSLNKLFAWYPKRHKSDDYKDWETIVELELLDQIQYNIQWNEWLEVSYSYFMPIYYKNGKKKKIDVFNFEKALTDKLCKHIPGLKDEHIQWWHVWKFDSDRNKVKIIIKEIKERKCKY